MFGPDDVLDGISKSANVVFLWWKEKEGENGIFQSAFEREVRKLRNRFPGLTVENATRMEGI